MVAPSSALLRPGVIPKPGCGTPRCECRFAGGGGVAGYMGTMKNIRETDPSSTPDPDAEVVAVVAQKVATTTTTTTTTTTAHMPTCPHAHDRIVGQRHRRRSP